MYDKEFEFKGRHSKYMQELKGENNFKIPVFNSFVEILMLAPIIGVIHNRSSEVDKDSSINPSTIFLEQLLRRKSDLNYISQLVLLNSHKDINLEERAKIVFNPSEEQKIKNENILIGFILGGVEVLYENILSDTHAFEDVVNNYYQFFSNYNFEHIKGEIVTLNLFDS